MHVNILMIRPLYGYSLIFLLNCYNMQIYCIVLQTLPFSYWFLLLVLFFINVFIVLSLSMHMCDFNLIHNVIVCYQLILVFYILVKEFLDETLLLSIGLSIFWYASCKYITFYIFQTIGWIFWNIKLIWTSRIRHLLDITQLGIMLYSKLSLYDCWVHIVLNFNVLKQILFELF